MQRSPLQRLWKQDRWLFLQLQASRLLIRLLTRCGRATGQIARIIIADHAPVIMVVTGQARLAQAHLVILAVARALLLSAVDANRIFNVMVVVVRMANV